MIMYNWFFKNIKPKTSNYELYFHASFFLLSYSPDIPQPQTE